jgi:hypothetical protein
MPNISYEAFKRELNSANSYNKTEFRLHLMKDINKYEKELRQLDDTHDSLVKSSSRIMTRNIFSSEEKENIKKELKRKETEYYEKRSEYENILDILNADLKEIKSSKHLRNPQYNNMLKGIREDKEVNELSKWPSHMLKYLPSSNLQKLKNRQTKRQRGGKKKQGRGSTRK